MKARRLVLLAAAVAVIGAPFALLGATYVGFSKAAWWEIERRGLPARDHNALKHAYAAAEYYSLARIFLGPDRAAWLVLALGEGNERMEPYLKHSVDLAPEAYKDMRNNLSGVVAAEWLYGEAGYTWPRTRLRLIGRLMEDGDLAAEYDDPRIPELPMAIETELAISTVQADGPELREGMMAELRAKSDSLKAELGL